MQVQDGPIHVPGFRLGHWTDPELRTGCTVIIAEKFAPAAVETRGASPGTRETTLLETGRTVQGVDAILLTGGSAFGLAAADGVMQFLRELGRGVPTPAIPVPIVAGAVIFDLRGNDPIFPTSESGYLAARDATNNWDSGRHGAGAAASACKPLGGKHAVATGLGVARATTAAGSITAVIVTNAFGDVIDPKTGVRLAKPAGFESTEEAILQESPEPDTGTNTVIGAIVCDRPLDHDALTRLTIAGNTGIARAVHPAHTLADGDTIFALAPEHGNVSSNDLLQLTLAAQNAVVQAIINSVTRS